jgi:hypothetical protein
MNEDNFKREINDLVQSGLMTVQDDGTLKVTDLGAVVAGISKN